MYCNLIVKIEVWTARVSQLSYFLIWSSVISRITNIVTNYLNLNFQTPEQLKFSCMAIAEGARLAGHINSETLSDIYNPESDSDRIKDRISSSSSDDEDSGPPPLPPPRTESLIKEAPIYQQRQNGIAAIANPEFEIPDRLAEAETVNGGCDHDQDQEESSLKFDVSSNFLFSYLINKVRNYFRVHFHLNLSVLKKSFNWSNF